MRKLFVILLILSLVLIPVTLTAKTSYRNGYEELFADDTLTTSGAATDSVYTTTTAHEAFNDTLKFSFWIKAKETGAQAGNLDIDLAFSPDGSTWSTYYALKADLDVGATCDDTWYHLPTVAANAVPLYCMKHLKVVIDNTDADANEVIIESFGIAFKEEK